MSKFYFHASDGDGLLPDEFGTDMDLADVPAHAANVIAELMDAGSGYGDWTDWTIDVVDEGGKTVYSERFPDDDA